MSLDPTYKPTETEEWYSCPHNPKIIESLERIKKPYFVQEGKIWYVNPKRYVRKG